MDHAKFLRDLAIRLLNRISIDLENIVTDLWLLWDSNFWMIRFKNNRINAK